MGVDINLRNSWAGIGTKIGGSMIAAGIESTSGVIWNLMNANIHMPVCIENARLGPGLGGGIGTSLLFIFNCANPFMIDGMEVSDWGFNFSIGPKWSALLSAWKACGYLNSIQEIRKALETTNKIQKVIKPDTFEKVKLGTNYLWQSVDLARGESKPVVAAFDLPFGSYGAEISLSYTVGKFTILPNG